MKSETTEKHKKLSSTDITCGVITLSASLQMKMIYPDNILQMKHQKDTP